MVPVRNVGLAVVFCSLVGIGCARAKPGSSGTISPSANAATATVFGEPTSFPWKVGSPLSPLPPFDPSSSAWGETARGSLPNEQGAWIAAESAGSEAAFAIVDTSSRVIGGIGLVMGGRGVSISMKTVVAQGRDVVLLLGVERRLAGAVDLGAAADKDPRDSHSWVALSVHEGTVFQALAETGAAADIQLESGAKSLRLRVRCRASGGPIDDLVLPFDGATHSFRVDSGPAKRCTEPANPYDE